MPSCENRNIVIQDDNEAMGRTPPTDFEQNCIPNVEECNASTTPRRVERNAQRSTAAPGADANYACSVAEAIISKETHQAAKNAAFF